MNKKVFISLFGPSGSGKLNQNFFYGYVLEHYNPILRKSFIFTNIINLFMDKR